MKLIDSDLAPALLVFVSFYILTVLFFVIVFWQISITRRKRITSQAARNQIIHDVVDGLSIDEKVLLEKKYWPRTRIRYVILLILGYTLIYVALYLLIIDLAHIISPDLDASSTQLFHIAISLIMPFIAAWLILPLIQRWLILSSPQRKMTDSEEWLWTSLGYIWWLTNLSVFAGIGLFLGIYNMEPLSAFFIFFAYGLILAALYIVLRKYLSFPVLWVQTALANVDYKEAVRRVEILDAKLPSGAAYGYGTVLLFAGRYTEAYGLFRRSLQEGVANDRFLSFVLTNLGYALLHQGRYAEATRAFEGALKLDPKAGHAVAGSAEVYLFQRIQTQRALDIIIDYLHKVLAGGQRDRTVWGAVLGDEAWAFAMLGQQAKAEASLDDAFQRMDRSFKPGLAGLHYRAGQVYKRNKQARAIKDFERAIELDPEGSWGQLSRQALQELGHTPQTPTPAQ